MTCHSSQSYVYELEWRSQRTCDDVNSAGVFSTCVQLTAVELKPQSHDAVNVSQWVNADRLGHNGRVKHVGLVVV